MKIILTNPNLILRSVDDILAAFEKEQDLLNFLNVLRNKYPNIEFAIEKQVSYSVAFIDVFISGMDN